MGAHPMERPSIKRRRRPGEAIFFSLGLGQTNPPMVSASSRYPSQIAGYSSFSVLMNGTPLDPSQVSTWATSGNAGST